MSIKRPLVAMKMLLFINMSSIELSDLNSDVSF